MRTIESACQLVKDIGVELDYSLLNMLCSNPSTFELAKEIKPLLEGHKDEDVFEILVTIKKCMTDGIQKGFYPLGLRRGDSRIFNTEDVQELVSLVPLIKDPPNARAIFFAFVSLMAEYKHDKEALKDILPLLPANLNSRDIEEILVCAKKLKDRDAAAWHCLVGTLEKGLSVYSVLPKLSKNTDDLLVYADVVKKMGSTREQLSFEAFRLFTFRCIKNPSCAIQALIDQLKHYIQYAKDDIDKYFIIESLHNNRLANAAPLQDELVWLQSITDQKVKYAAASLLSNSSVKTEVLRTAIKKVENLLLGLDVDREALGDLIQLPIRLPSETWDQFLKTMQAIMTDMSKEEKMAFINVVCSELEPDNAIEVLEVCQPLIRDLGTYSLSIDDYEDLLKCIVLYVGDQKTQDERQKAQELLRIAHHTAHQDCRDAYDWFCLLGRIGLEGTASLVRIQQSLGEISLPEALRIGQGRFVADLSALQLQQLEQLLNSITSVAIRRDLLRPLSLLHARLGQITTMLEGIEDSPRRVELLHLIIDTSSNMQETLISQGEERVRTIALPDERYAALVALFSPHLPVYAARGKSYELSLVRDDLAAHPLQLLHSLAELFSKKTRSTIRVDFLNEVGIDAGGLGRTFVTELVHNVKEKLPHIKVDNGLVIPHGSALSDEQKQAYSELGQLFMFILNASMEYPTGMFYDYSLFYALTHIKDHLLNQTLEKLIQGNNTFLELLDLYCGMHSLNEKKEAHLQKLRQYCEPFTDKTPQSLVKEAFYAASLEYDDAFCDVTPHNIMQHLPMVQEAVKEWVADEILRPTFTPIFEIAKGVRDSPFTKTKVQTLQPTTLSEAIQGRLSTDIVLKRLQFAANIPETTQSWFRAWIRSLDLQSLGLFVLALTGTRALGSLPLEIHTREKNAYFHTCFNSADLPIQHAKSEQELIEMMNAILVGIDKEKYNRA